MSFIPVDQDQFNAAKAASSVDLFFRKDDLLHILNRNRCVGVRFYKAHNNAGDLIALAIGVGEDRRERNRSTRYICGRSMSREDRIEWKKARAVEGVTGVSDFNAIFSKDDLIAIMDYETCVGIHLIEEEGGFENPIPEEWEDPFYDNFMVYGGDEEGNFIPGVTEQMLRGRPCPPDCVNDNRYLNPNDWANG